MGSDGSPFFASRREERPGVPGSRLAGVTTGRILATKDKVGQKMDPSRRLAAKIPPDVIVGLERGPVTSFALRFFGPILSRNAARPFGSIPLATRRRLPEPFRPVEGFNAVQRHHTSGACAPAFSKIPEISPFHRLDFGRLRACTGRPRFSLSLLLWAALP